VWADEAAFFDQGADAGAVCWNGLLGVEGALGVLAEALRVGGGEAAEVGEAPAVGDVGDGDGAGRTPHTCNLDLGTCRGSA
jgi:hypothetical protein